MTARRLSVLGLVLCGCLGLPAPASAYVYWTNQASGTIARADLTGSGANESFISGAGRPLGIAVDTQHIYWSNANGTIGRANLDGSHPDAHFITGAHGPAGIAVTDHYIYWANGANGTIGRANIDGSGVDQSFITGAKTPAGVTVSGKYVYWGNDDYPSNISIGRANLDGTSVDENFIKYAGAVQIAVNNQFIYWADFQSQEIFRAKLDGTGSSALITTAGAPSGLAVDANHIYWGNDVGEGGGSIGRADLDGSHPEQKFITGANAPGDIAVDSGGPGASCHSGHLDLGKELDKNLDITGCFSAGKKGTFVSSGDVNVNGIHFEPASGTITIDPGGPSLKATGDGVVKVGGVVPIWAWSGQMSIPLSGEITLQNDVSAKLFGFPIDGSLKAQFTGGDANLTGTVEFRLKEVEDIEADLTVTTDNAQGLAGAGIEIKGADEAPGHTDGEQCDPSEEPPSGFTCGTTVTYKGAVYHGLVPIDPAIIHIGPVGVEDLHLAYDPAANQWSGGGTVDLGEVFSGPFKSALPALGVQVTITPTHSKGSAFPFQVDSFSATDSGLDQWIGPVDLQELSFHWDSNPFGLGGDVSLRTDGGVAIDGGFDYESGDTGFKLKVNGTVSLSDVTTISGFVSFNDEDGGGQIGLGGSWERTFGPAWAKLGVSGGVAWNEQHNWSWELDGDGSAGVFGVGVQAHGVISNAGAGACGEESVFGFDVQVGFKHYWNGSTDFNGCDFSGLHTVGQGSAASGAAGQPITVAPGVSKEEFAVVGANAPPDVMLTGPHGESLSTPTKPNRLTATPRGLELAVSDTKTTYLTVVHPAAGRWTITPIGGSPAPVRYEVAAPMAPLDLKARVLGTGQRRTLSWSFHQQPGLTVAFIQTGATTTSGTTSTDITGTGQGRGRTRFALAPGPGGTRHVIGVVSVDGFPRQRLTVASFSAASPKLPRVRSASYSIRHGKLTLRWTRVPHATSYAVSIRLGPGTQEYVIKGTQATATFRVPKGLRVRRVTVTTTARGMTGHPVRARETRRHRRKRHS